MGCTACRCCEDEEQAMIVNSMDYFQDNPELFEDIVKLDRHDSITYVFSWTGR